jgi:hypothetical protein
VEVGGLHIKPPKKLPKVKPVCHLSVANVSWLLSKCWDVVECLCLWNVVHRGCSLLSVTIYEYAC